MRRLATGNRAKPVSLNWEKVKESSIQKGEFVYLPSKARKQLNFKYRINPPTLYFPRARRLKTALHIRNLISTSPCQIVVAFSYKSACSPESAMPKFNRLQRTSIQWNETLCWKEIVPGQINKVILWGSPFEREFLLVLSVICIQKLFTLFVKSKSIFPAFSLCVIGIEVDSSRILLAQFKCDLPKSTLI